MKRATQTEPPVNTKDLISIHALVKRATSAVDGEVIYDGISIHALVKRATDELTDEQVKALHFNPRPREEGDLMLSARSKQTPLFQSTPS